MLIRVPGARARRVAERVSVVDAFPTLIGLTGSTLFGPFLAQASGRDALAPGAAPVPQLGRDDGYRIDDPEYRYCLTSGRWIARIPP